MLLIGGLKSGNERRFYRQHIALAERLYDAHLKTIGNKVRTMAKSFSDLTKGVTGERRSRIEARKAELRREMDLAELRRAFELTQASLAETLGVGQAEVSKIEKRSDMLLSTLRKFVQAMGGELEIRATFPDHTVTISGLSALGPEK